AGGHSRVVEHPRLRPRLNLFPRSAPGVLAERDVHGRRAAALAHDLDLDGLPRLVPGEHRAERVRGHGRLAVDGDDHVACAEPGLGRRGAARDAADVDALTGVADADAEVGAVRVDDLAVLDDLAGDVLDGV